MHPTFYLQEFTTWHQYQYWNFRILLSFTKTTNVFLLVVMFFITKKTFCIAMISAIHDFFLPKTQRRRLGIFFLWHFLSKNFHNSAKVDSGFDFWHLKNWYFCSKGIFQVHFFKIFEKPKFFYKFVSITGWRKYLWRSFNISMFKMCRRLWELWG